MDQNLSPSSIDVLSVTDTQIIPPILAADPSPASDASAPVAQRCLRCGQVGPHCDRCLNCADQCRAARNPELECGDPEPEWCGADWGSGTPEQRCVLPTGHDGEHVDAVGGWSHGLPRPVGAEDLADWERELLAKQEAAQPCGDPWCSAPSGHGGPHVDHKGNPHPDAAPPTMPMMPTLVTPPPLSRIPFHSLASSLVEIQHGLGDLADLVFVERGGLGCDDVNFTPDRLAVQFTREIRDGSEPARQAEVERLASLLGVIPLREHADGFDWYVAKKTFGTGRVMYAAVTRVEPLPGPVGVDWEATRRELARDVTLVDERESEPIR